MEQEQFEMRGVDVNCDQMLSEFYEPAVELQPEAAKLPNVASKIDGNKAFDGMVEKKDVPTDAPATTGTGIHVTTQELTPPDAAMPSCVLSGITLMAVAFAAISM